MKLRKAYLILILSLTITLSGSNFSSAQITPFDDNPEMQDINSKIKEKQQTIDNLKKAADDYSAKIEQKMKESQTLKGQISILDNQITKIEIDVKMVQNQIDKTKLEIESYTKQIADEEAKIDVLKDRLKEYIKMIYRYNQKSYLQMVILNSKFSDFYTQLNYAEDIENELKDSLDQIKIYKEALALKKADLEKSQTDLNALKEQYQERQQKYQDEQDGKTVLLYQTKASENEYATLLLQLKQQQNQIDSEIINLKDEVKRKLVELETGVEDAGLLNWPVSPGKGITASFHDPEYPFRYLFEHPAIDIRCSQGTEIKAPAAGYVSIAKDAGYGYSYIILIHDNGLATVYGHVSGIYVKADQIVKRGQVIGKSGGMPGTRGAGRMTTGPHLHFEVRLNGIPVNPLDYLP